MASYSSTTIKQVHNIVSMSTRQQVGTKKRPNAKTRDKLVVVVLVLEVVGIVVASEVVGAGVVVVVVVVVVVLWLWLW